MVDTSTVRVAQRGFLAQLFGPKDHGVALARQARRFLRQRPHETAVLLTEDAQRRHGITGSVQLLAVIDSGTHIHFELYNGDRDPIRVAPHEIDRVDHDEAFVAA